MTLVERESIARPRRAKALSHPVLVMAVGLVGVSLAVLLGFRVPDGGPSVAEIGAALLVAVSLVVTGYTAGFPGARVSLVRALVAAAVAVAANVALGAVSSWGTDLDGLPTAVIVAIGGLAVLWLLAVGRLATHRRGEPDRVVFVGPQDAADRLASSLPAAERSAVLVGTQTLGESAMADVVVIGEGGAFEGTVSPPAVVVSEAEFREQWLRQVVPASDDDIDGAQPNRRYEAIKRAVDVLVALVGLGALVLLVVPVLIGNLFANRGPLIYRQIRFGRDARSFAILKLRTMRAAPDTDAGDGADWTSDERDPRITSWGRVLRASHLDELPQVVNVLRGEISIVGPRPSPTRYVHDFLAGEAGYGARLSVAPGVTGWAQVKYGYAGDAVGAQEKLAYDLYYVTHRSTAFDLRIMARTFRTIFGIRGR